MKVKILKKKEFLFLLLMLCLLSDCNSGKKPVIDLSSAEKSTSANNSSSSTHPTLNVAVGAMLSPETTRDYYTDILEKVASDLGCSLSVYQRRTYSEINNLVKNKTVDLALVCTGAYIAGNRDFRMELLVIPVSNGESVYYSYIIVNRNSNLNSITDLRGKVFAFTDPESNTGNLSPKYILAQQGDTPESFFRDTFYTYSHDNSIKAVADNVADAAAVDSLIWEYLIKTADPDAESTRIILRSDPYGIPPVVVHPDLDEDMKQELKTIFLKLHLDDETQEQMRKVNIDRFVEGDDSIYESVRRMKDHFSR